MADALVSIIVLAHNKSRHTERCLRGLLESTWPQVEAVLVDNGSADDTRAVFAAFSAQAAARGWRVETILQDTNIGAVEARNQALRRAHGDHIVFLDNDVVIGVRSWLERLTRILQEDATIGVLGPKILFAEPPHNIQCAGCVVCRGGRVDFRGRGEPADAPAFQARAEVQALISACWILPRRVAEAVGELDMRFHPVQFEDIDYCYRIRAMGLRAVYDPEVFVYHFENVTTDGTPALNYRYLTVKNGLKFKNKWRHVFAKENGPEDASIVWKEIPHVRLEAVGALPIRD